uniref:Uncharacterized protein n=1 Tax=Heterorhabditis bacteriophora TaxID=37862 RepID=A0A1I7WIN1_HETBA
MLGDDGDLRQAFHAGWSPDVHDGPKAWWSARVCGLSFNKQALFQDNHSE